MERERAGQRTHDALTRRARAGQVANGTVFGYRNVRGASHSTRVIEPAEAAVIVQVFERSAAGWGYQRIARTLTSGPWLRHPAGRAGRPHGR
jgi:DNA invertase Pin-like site-specific DNA recombinase